MRILIVEDNEELAELTADEDYYHEVVEKAKRFAQAEEMRERADHLQAFNFGRTVQRIENSPFDVCLHVGCLLAEVTIGMAFGRIYPNYLYPALAHRFLTQARLFVGKLGKTRLYSFWKRLRVRA
jgi:hypothetical protein